MTDTNQNLLERFIDHIETNDMERSFWLKRIRQLGIDHVLIEFGHKPTPVSETRPTRQNQDIDLNNNNYQYNF